MKLEEKIREAMVNQIVTTGYNDRMEKIAENGIDDIAGINYTEVVRNGLDANGALTKQAADETLIREIRRQIVLTGYQNAQNNQ